jgi:NADH-quinone oxidoreductase subunit N
MFLDQFVPITISAIFLAIMISFIPFIKKISYKVNYAISIILSVLMIICVYYIEYSIFPALALFLPLIALNQKTNDNINYIETEHLFLLFFMLIGTYQILYATNFISFYIGLEMQSIPLYIIISLVNTRKDKISDTIKYFVLSAVFSALTLLGIAYLYGAFGCLGFVEIAKIIPSVNKNTAILSVFGTFLVLIGSFFKLTMPPFHLLISDIYAALNYRMITVLSIMPKIAFVVLIINILHIFAGSGYVQLMESIIFGTAICGIFVGSVGLLAQNNLKRFIAYSGIIQIGFVLMAVASGGNISVFQHIIKSKSIALLYLFGYLISLLPFTVILNNMNEKCTIESLSGLIKNNKIICYCLSSSLLSFAGVPIFIGFATKVMIFINLIAMFNIWAMILVLIPMIIALYVYINLIGVIYFGDKNDNIIVLTISEKIIVYGCTICNIIGIFFVPQIIELLNI